MLWRSLFVCIFLFTHSVWSDEEKLFRIILSPDDWASLGDVKKMEDDVVLMRDGTRLKGHVMDLPPISYSFGEVFFSAEEVSAIAIAPSSHNPRMQYVTRNGQNFIGPLVSSEFLFAVKQIENPTNKPSPAAKALADAVQKKRKSIQSEYVPISLSPYSINTILLKKRKEIAPLSGSEVLSVILKNGDRFPVFADAFEIRLRDGHKRFKIETRQISDVWEQGGLQGFLKGETLDLELPLAILEDEYFAIRLAKDLQPYNIPWSDIKRVLGDNGQFVITTPYMFQELALSSMTFIPHGRFFFGSNEPPLFQDKKFPALQKTWPISPSSLAQISQISYVPNDQSPALMVDMPSFFIDTHEVTNDQYMRFVEATGHRLPIHWKGGKIPTGKEQHPVVNVSFEDAQDYALWMGKRLPTEVEWERAAKGASGLRYPYGMDYDPSLGNVATQGTRRVGSFESLLKGKAFDATTSQLLLTDMSGNAAEWTTTTYEADWHEKLAKLPKLTNPENRARGPMKVVRGGSFAASAPTATTTYRAPMYTEDFNDHTGFRCAMDVR